MRTVVIAREQGRAGTAGDRALLSAALVVGVVAGGAAPVQAAPSATADVRLSSDIQLRSRAAGSTPAWDAGRRTYDRAYVYPTRWEVRLDACGSRVDDAPIAGSNQPGPTWVLEPLDGQASGPVTRTAATGQCAATVPLNVLGRWRVTTALTTPDGRSAHAVQELPFRDVLVAAVGDSFASGEGNRLEGWADERCHRSDAAWPSLVARSLEDAATAVTFVSFACTGAKIEDVVGPQLAALRALLGAPTAPSTRPVDVLLGTAGINALGVGGILEDCSVAGGLVTTCRRDLSRPLASLPELYKTLELKMSHQVRIGHAYFSEYPQRVFTNASDAIETCGVFRRMGTADAEWVERSVRSVDRHLRAAGARHGWTVVGTTDLFRRHGYCAGSQTWFRDWTSSTNRQGDTNGTAHPNLQGHRATADAVRAAVRTLVPAPAPDDFLVRFLRVRVTDGRRALFPGQVRLGMGWGLRSACGREYERLDGVRLGAWIDLSGLPCLRWSVRTAGTTVSVSAFTALGNRRVTGEPPQDTQQPPGGGPRRTPGRPAYTIERLHTRATGWGATGSVGPQRQVHRMVASHDQGTFEVEYEVVWELKVAGSAPVSSP